MKKFALIAAVVLMASGPAWATEKYANFLTSSIPGVVASTSTVFAVASNANFPSLQTTNGDFFRVTVIRASDGAKEIMFVTNYVSVTVSVTRARESTSALDFTTNDSFRHQVTSGMLEGLSTRDTLTIASPTGSVTVKTVAIQASRATTLEITWKLIDAATATNTYTTVPPTGSSIVRGVKVTNSSGFLQLQFTHGGASRTWYLQIEINGQIYISEAITLG